MHGSNRLGGNSLSDLLVFGRRAGLHAARVRGAAAAGGHAPPIDAAQSTRRRPRRCGPSGGRRPRTGDLAENPYTLHQELQQTMNDLVGIIRREAEMEQALEKLAALRVRAAAAAVEGHRQFNPGWHLALDLRNMLLVSECVARAALERHREPRRPHPRGLSGDGPQWRRVNLLCRLADPAAGPAADRPGARPDRPRTRRPPSPIRPDLLALFEKEELVKYLAEEELPRVSAYKAHVQGVARRRGRRRLRGLHRRGERGRGRPGHHPPPPGDPGPRPGGALELQGGQVRFVQRGDQRPAPAAVHDPDVGLRPRTRRSP